MRLIAPAKINLCLYLGTTRADGLHRLASIFEPVALADELEISTRTTDSGADSWGDRVRYRFAGTLATVDESLGVDGGDTVSRALELARATGLGGPYLDVEVRKRIPSGAGLGGGSADAGAILRYLRDSDEHKMPDGSSFDPMTVALEVGADVPSQIEPAACRVGGAGEIVEPLAPAGRHFLVLVTGGGGLSTGRVFAEADRMGLPRDDDELDRLDFELGAIQDPLADPESLANDLERAAFSLRPELGELRNELSAHGAQLARMSGSGATVFGVFGSREEAERAAERLRREDAVVIAGGVPINEVAP